MRIIFSVSLLAFLAACGADGAPKAPKTQTPPSTAVTVTGKASIGVVHK